MSRINCCLERSGFPPTPVACRALKERDLSRVARWYRMTHSATRLIRLGAANHDLRRVIGSRPTPDQPLIAAGGASAEDANRVQLVDDLGDSHQFRHRSERLTPKIGIGPGDDHPTPPGSQRGHQLDDAIVEKLGFVDSDDVGSGVDLLGDLCRRIRRNRFDGTAVVTGDRVDAGVALVEMGLEDLYPLAGDDGAPHASNQLLTLAAEHHAGNDLDPSTTLMEWPARPTHDRSRSLRGGPPRVGPRRGGAAPGRPRGGPLRSRGGPLRSREPCSERSPLGAAERSRSSLSRSARTTTLRPRIIDPLRRWITLTASDSATSTSAWLSRRSIFPTRSPGMPPSPAITPIRSPTLTPSRVPMVMNSRVIPPRAASPADGLGFAAET